MHTLMTEIREWQHGECWAHIYHLQKLEVKKIGCFYLGMRLSNRLVADHSDQNKVGLAP